MAENSQGETKFCTNCKRDISANNFVMHEMHCKRHITLCEHCKEPVPKAEIEEHFEANHKQVPCEKCKKLLEKNAVEKHEKNDCTERLVKCTYCEIDLPYSSLAGHIDYCGSRTEQCYKCGQYIQKQDEVQHEQTNCAYPDPKPVENNNTRVDTINQLLNEDQDYALAPDEQYFNSFSFDEMSRIMGNPSQFSDDGLLGRMSKSYTEGSSGANRIQNNTQAKLKNKNRVQELRNKTNKKSDLNRNRETHVNRDSGQPPADCDDTNDYDRMLAMHLAQDLNGSDDDLEDIIRRLEKDTPNNHQPDNIETSNTNRLSEDEFLPCEFCDEIFSLDILADHQSSCQSDPLGSLVDSSDLNNQLETLRNNNRRTLEVPIERNNISPIVSPIGEEITNDWWPNAVASDRGLLDEEENFCLPCEFCHEPFPVDMLVQHQSVCDLSQPLSSQSTVPKRRTTLLNNRLANSVSPPPPPSRRHQVEPTLDPSSYDTLDDTGTQRRKKVAVTNNVRTSRPSVQNSGLRGSSLQSSAQRHAISGTNASSNGRSQMNKNTRPGVPRRRSGDEENSYIGNVLHERPSQKKPSSRSREALNRHTEQRGGLRPDLSPYELLTQQNKAVKNKDNLAIRGSVGTKKKTKPVTSPQEVQREVERINAARRAQAKPQNRNPDLNVAVTNATASSGRQRSNYMFNYQPTSVTRTRRPTRPSHENDDDDDDDYL